MRNAKSRNYFECHPRSRETRFEIGKNLSTTIGSGANLIIMDNRRHDPTLLQEARTLQRPSFQSSSYHSGRTVVRHLQTELSRCVRSDGGARRHGRTYHRFAMGPTLRSRLRETVEDICAPSRLILES